MTKEQAAEYLMKDRLHLSAYISSITRSYQSAEDIFQEVCLKAISMADSFNDIAHLQRWSRQVGRNKAIDVFRRARKHKKIFDEALLKVLENEWPGHEDRNLSAEKEALYMCMEEMTENNREIVRLRYFQGMSGVNVAQRLNRKATAIYKSLARIHCFLRECLQKHLAELEVR